MHDKGSSYHSALDDDSNVKVEKIQEKGKSDELHIPDFLCERLNRASYVKCSNYSPNSVSKPSIELRTLCVKNLPEWAEADGLRALIMEKSFCGIEHILHNNEGKPNFISNIQVVRDPETNKCVSYGYVEFTEHAIAAEILATFNDSKSSYPGSSKQLCLDWAIIPVSPSSVLEAYHFYIGNFDPDVSENQLLKWLMDKIPSVASVKVMPREILGNAPWFRSSGIPSVKKAKTSPDEASDPHLAVDISKAFYCCSFSSRRQGPLPCENNYYEAKHSKKDYNNFEDFESRKWSAGFIRLKEEAAHNWKAILRDIQNAVNSTSGIILRRKIAGNLDTREKESLSLRLTATAIIVRPLFGRFDCFDSESTFLNSRQSSTQGTMVTAGRSYNRQTLVEELQNRTTLFIGNISEETTDHDLFNLLSPFGSIVSVRVAFLKHVGFIEMGDYRSALCVLSHLTGSLLKGHKLQFDWGRGKLAPQILNNLTSTNKFDSYNNETLPSLEKNQEERKFEIEMLTAMKPKKKIESCSIPPEEEDPLKNQVNKEIWLSSLYLSLPSRNNNKSRGNTKDKATNDPQRETC